MFKVKIKGMVVECETARDVRSILGLKMVDREKRKAAPAGERRILEFDMPVKDMKSFGKHGSRKGKLYSTEEKEAVLKCTKVSELKELAAKFERPLNPLVSFWYYANGYNR